MKHTTGSWTITDDRFIAVDEKELICEVYDRANFMPRKGTIVPDEETAEANARLISAAPDMLEALFGSKALGKNGAFYDKIILEKIEAAINKAILK